MSFALINQYTCCKGNAKHTGIIRGGASINILHFLAFRSDRGTIVLWTGEHVSNIINNLLVGSILF